MTIRRTVLNVEQLGARVLPSATVPVPTTTATTAAAVQASTAWNGAGRFTLTTASGTTAETYTLQGSADFGSSGFLAIAGSVTTVGNKAGEATGRITLSIPKGTLTLSLTGPSQSANSALPTSFTYKVLSGTGTFAHYSGTGKYSISPTLFPGYDDRGNFSVSGTMPTVTTTTPPPKTTPTPPVTTPPAKTTAGPSWTGQGRYTTVTSSTSVQTYTFQGTADFGSSNFFAISGTIQTVGNKSGQATGKLTLSDPRGTLVLAVTGATQSAKSGLPFKFTYKIVSGTGYFAHYAGTGAIQMYPQLWPGFDNAGHFVTSVKPNA